MNFKLTLGIISIITLTLLFSNSYIFNKDMPVTSNKIVVEAWLSAGDLELMSERINFKKIDTIYVSGVRQKYSPAGFSSQNLPVKLFSNACLKIMPDSMFTKIKIQAHGNTFKGIDPLLTIVQNEQIIKNLFISKICENYVIQFSSSNEPIYIYYSNDASGEGEDRNIIINEIEVNEKKLMNIDVLPDYKVNFDKNSNYPFTSNAKKTANYLKVLYPNCFVMYVDTMQSINKTMVAAEKLAEFLKFAIPQDFNIVSVYGHSTRSYLAYKKNFPETQIGIISLDNRKFRKQKTWYQKLNYIADEYVSILVTAVFCL